MHLISALAAGITGAANGTAELYTRGTSTRATYYTDFEGNSANSSGANIDLDANGGATIYVNSTVTVVVKDSDGETVRTFTDGVTASSIEVISDSFTGTDYDDASSGVNKPIALDAVLDKWDNSAGADDWQVLINSTATNISTALAGLSGMFYNVKDPAYGAEGDGSTDDTAAIQAAIDAATAASGGIIFFPPGTYLITDTLDVDDELVLMGAGSKRSVISIDNASNADAIDIGNSGASDVERYAIKDLGFSCAQANTGDFIDNISTYTDITIKDCYFDTTNLTGKVLDVDTVDCLRLVFKNNYVYMDSVLTNCLDIGDASTVYGIFIQENTFLGATVQTNPVISVGGYFNINSNLIWCTGAAAGLNCVEVSASGFGTIKNNIILPGSGSTVHCLDETAGNHIIESGNHDSSVNAVLTDGDITSKGLNQTFYRSREDLYLNTTFSSGGAQTIDGVEAAIYFINININASITLNTDYIAPPGAELILVFQMMHAAPASPTITWGAHFVTAAATFDLSAQYKMKAFHFRSTLSADTGGTVNLKWQEITSTEHDWS